ncbi:hypothetical protein [Massilia sp. TN1-12]|uniref:hypothetical protein n=1 Tax=Massilia paldalensis TaxID=3377675 RepID=UPI00384FA886
MHTMTISCAGRLFIEKYFGLPTEICTARYFSAICAFPALQKLPTPQRGATQ